MLEHQTGDIAVEIIFSVGFTVGVVVTAALTVGFVAATVVLGFSSGTEHHDVVLIRAIQTLAVGPGVLAVPAGTPGTVHVLSGVERGDRTCVPVLTVGIHIKRFCAVVSGFISLFAIRQLVQRSAEGACIDAGGAAGGAAGEGRQRGVAVTARVVAACLGGRGGGDLATLAPVCCIAGGAGGQHACKQRNDNGKDDDKGQCPG